MHKHCRHCSGNGLNKGLQGSAKRVSNTSPMEATVVW